jgi:glycosyltransferase involved in cell wall biosynthesis
VAGAPEPRQRPVTVCFVTTELAGVAGSGEIGAHVQLIGKKLARQGWQVHFLLCGGDGQSEDQPPGAVAVTALEGVAVHWLGDFPTPPGARIRHFGGDDPTVVLGEHALEALGELHAEHRLDLIEFPDRGALGLRSVQSKVAGDALLDVSLAVKLHGPSQWLRERDLKQRSAPRDLKLEFCERHAFERADIQVSASHDMLDCVCGLAWEVTEMAETCEAEFPSERVAAVYRRLLSQPAISPSARVSEPATVTVAVAHYNHDRFLPGALASLAAQTRPADEVVVVDDGSTSEAARRVFSEQEAHYPDWTFVGQDNAGPGAARNAGLELAAGTYFLPFDSDNVATPRLIERLLAAMERNPSRAATTCHNLAFVDDADIEAGHFTFRYSPTGGPRLSACLENVYGDTCALFRAESLRAVGGFEGHRWSPHEDWETFAKMSLCGLEVEVLPQPLFYYRTEAGGRLQALTADPATSYRLRAHLIDEFFADADLAPREHRDLWECLQAFDRFATEGVDARLKEQRLWHDSQMADLHAYRLAQLKGLRARLDTEIEAQRSRAEAAEGELAALKAVTPRRLLRRALRSARSRVAKSSGPVS